MLAVLIGELIPFLGVGVRVCFLRSTCYDEWPGHWPLNALDLQQAQQANDKELGTTTTGRHLFCRLCWLLVYQLLWSPSQSCYFLDQGGRRGVTTSFKLNKFWSLLLNKFRVQWHARVWVAPTTSDCLSVYKVSPSKWHKSKKNSGESSMERSGYLATAALVPWMEGSESFLILR